MTKIVFGLGILGSLLFGHSFYHHSDEYHHFDYRHCYDKNYLTHHKEYEKTCDRYLTHHKEDFYHEEYHHNEYHH